ncbi:unnamed protein product [Cuscuta europaea]|uniref:MADS-box domain-containing protein n=1 Tax=Cuscuta europaea TaxID=41803 RepID=A0A9P0ZR90_CUSEU|nr:unnamed protein product [Cuscuta europaea]
MYVILDHIIFIPSTLFSFIMSSNTATKRVNRGRQRIPFTKVEDETNRKVMFSKRRSGLFKKASELCALTGVDIAIVIFSPANKAYSFGNPNLDVVLNRYFGETDTSQENAANEILRAHHEANMSTLTPLISDMESQIDDQMKSGQAYSDAEICRPHLSDLHLDQLKDLKYHMEELRFQTYEKLKEASKSEMVTTPMGIGGVFVPFSCSGINNDGVGPSGTS